MCLGACVFFFFFFSSRRRHTRSDRDWSSDVCSSDLLREPSLAGLPLTPTVHVPMWTGTPATIDVTGQVPRPELKDLAVRLVSDEASRIRSDIKIVDRLSIVPTAAQAA